MKLRNRNGTPVDAVPFLVVALLGVLLCFSYGPGYLLAFGVPLRAAVATSTAVAVGLSVASFHRYVWTVNPAMRAEVPAELRLKRLFYGAVILGLVLSGLSLPLWVR